MKGFLINNKFLFCIYFLFLLPIVLYSQNYIDQQNLFSPESRLKFGSYLYSEEDYLRASVEFREYLKYVDNDTVRFKFATCFYKIGRFQEAADNFKGLFTSRNLQQESKLAYYKSVFFQKNYSLFRISFNNEFHIPWDYKDEIKRLYYISFFFDNSVLPDTNNFFSSFPDSNKSVIKQFYFRKKFPEYKNPTTAALLSGLIPGLGKIYVGEITDGFTSLLVTGVLTFLAIDNFKHNHNFRGWLFAGLGAYFYGGNIYGSAAAAQIFNAGVKFNFDSDVRLYFEKRNYLLPEIKL